MEILAYDILRKDALGTPIWIEAARDLESAKQRVDELSRRSPGEYLVFCQRSNQIVSAYPQDAPAASAV